jgi:hypothetical protein
LQNNFNCPITQCSNAVESTRICNPSELRYVLETLDTDDVRIQKSSKRRKIFISRCSSGLYAMQLTNGKSRKSDHGEMVEYIDSVEVLHLIESVFSNGASYCVY